LGIAGRRVKQTGTCEVWKKPLSDGSLAVALINRGSIGSDLTLRASDIGLLDTPKSVRNLWAQADIAEFGEAWQTRIQPHETLLLKIKA
jgi:alpha-galactosidase